MASATPHPISLMPPRLMTELTAAPARSAAAAPTLDAPLSRPGTLAQLTGLAEGLIPDGTVLLDQLPVAVLVCDLAGRIVSRNQTYQTIFADGAPYRLQHLRDLFDPRSRAQLPAAIGQAFASATAGRGGVTELVAGCQQPDGTPLQCNVVLRLFAPTDAEAETSAAHLVVVVRPLGPQARQIERLQASEHRFATLLRHLPVGIIGSESGLRADYVNAAGADVFGVGPELLVGLGWLGMIHPDDVDGAADAVEDALSARRPAFVPLRLVRPDGEERWVHLRVAPVGMADDMGFVASIEDVTDRRLLSDAVSYQSRHDLLTGLLNRSMVEERLQEFLDRAVPHGAQPALLLVDLDDFKDINDGLGHLVGDQVLTVMADRLFACAQPYGAVARFGGDEFVVILADLASAELAVTVARNLVATLSRPFQIEGHDIHCTASIGVAWLGDDEMGSPDAERAAAAVSPTEFLRRGDLALYQAKRAGKNQVVLATTELLQAEGRRLQLARSLRHTIDHDRLNVHFQPIVDLSNDRIVGLEALVRWNDPELGRISPDVFIPAAEANGLIGDLGRIVLRRALQELAQWRRLSGYGRLYVSVNMSMHELDEQAVAGQLAQALALADLPASALYIELTESALLKRETTALERLDAIRRLGIRLAIDDFGTGYSSLARLRHLPVDLIKIDREFIRDLGTDRQAGAMVGAIANLAGSMGLLTVAEGIETEVQLAELRKVAGGFGQGYLFSEPIPAESVPDLLLRRPLRRCA